MNTSRGDVPSDVSQGRPVLETSLATMSERATKTFLQSPAATPDTAARSRAKVLTLGMSDWVWANTTARQRQVRRRAAANTMMTTVRAHCFKTRVKVRTAQSHPALALPPARARTAARSSRRRGLRDGGARAATQYAPIQQSPSACAELRGRADRCSTGAPRPGTSPPPLGGTRSPGIFDDTHPGCAGDPPQERTASCPHPGSRMKR